MQTSNQSTVSLQHCNGKVNEKWLTFVGLFADVADCESEEAPLVIGDTEDFWNPYHRQGIDYAEPEIQ